MSFPAKDLILGAAELVDAGLGGLFPASSDDDGRAGSLTVFLFHRFFLDEELAPPMGVFPHERVSVSRFEDLIRGLKAQGFSFVLPRDVAAGRHIGKRAVMITVDDGYADNVRVLPVLERHDAKAAVFICPANIVGNKRFWPDALHIGAMREGWRLARTRRQRRALTKLPCSAAERRLVDWFGADILTPSGALDRALSVDELRTMARSPRVEFGCHGYDHTVLAPRSDGFVLDQLRRSRSFFEQVIGYAPAAISYPNGVYSDALLGLCRDFGFKTGITIEARGNRLGPQTAPQDMLALGRFTVSGTRRIDRQIHSTQVRWSVMRALYGLKTTKVAAGAEPHRVPGPAPRETTVERI